jgi:7-cyano-7-deazaguanine reductase
MSHPDGHKILTYKDIDKSLLKSLPNPDKRAYEIKLKVPECTFLGVQEQPDFAVVYISFYPKNKIIELKSMKYYFYHLRNIVVSYERLINMMYDHFMEAYDPERLRITMIYNPRGGISAKLTVDSDWKVRGGEEKFRDWESGRNDDEWQVTV